MSQSNQSPALAPASSVLPVLAHGAARLTLFLASTAVFAGALVACPQSDGSCISSQECPVGEVCLDGACVARDDTPSPTPSPGTAQPSPSPGVEGPGDGGVEGPADEVQLDVSPSYLQYDPEDDSKALVPQSWSNDDRLLSLDLETGDLTELDIYNFRDSAGGDCNPALVDYVEGGVVAERWLSCQSGGAFKDASLRVAYDGQENDLVFTPGISMNAIAQLPDMVDSSDPRRVVTFVQGTGELTVVQLDPAIDRYTTRAVDTIDVSFTAIQQVVVPPLPSNASGETILVFDRGAGQLVPLFHQPQTETWVAHPSLSVLDVGTDTAWLFFDLNNINVNGQGDGAANVLALKPTVELMQPYSVESATTEGSPLQMTATSGIALSDYDDDERPLVSQTPTGDTGFWVNKGHDEVLRIQLDFNNLQDASAERAEGGEQLTAIIAASDSQVWAALASEPLLKRVTFDN